MDQVIEIVELTKSGNIDELEKMLEQNAELAFAKTEEGISFLMLAAYYRNNDAVSVLKKYKKTVDYFESAAIGDIETVKRELEQNRTNINSFSPDGFTALGLASFFGNAQIVAYLLQKGADPNIASANSFHVTPLHSACAISNFEIVLILIKNGADVNAKQMSGVTPLHSAAHNGQTKIAKLLIENGAYVNAETDEGETPLSMAEEKNFEETARLIRQTRAK